MAKLPAAGKRSAERRFGGFLGVSVALLVLAAGCAGTSGGTATPVGDVSSAGPSAAAPSATQMPTSSAPSTPPASPVAVRTTHVAPAPVYTSAAAAPAPVTQAPQPAQTTVQPQPQSCYPLTDGGKCYSPGEYCRDDDHGQSGIDGDGAAIVCEDNDGWRWERQ